MILQALADYYQRRCADPDPARRLPAFGLERKEIGFLLDINPQGRLLGITDVRQTVGSKRLGKPCLVPQSVKRASGIAANLLWDSAEYMLALPDPKKRKAAADKGQEAEYLDRLKAMQRAFLGRILALPMQAQQDAGVQAVLAFLAADPADQALGFADGVDMASANAALALRLYGDIDLVCQRPGVAPFLAAAAALADAVGEGEPARTAPVQGDPRPVGERDGASPRPDGRESAAPADAGVESRSSLRTRCLVSGEYAPIERLHAAIKGVWGAQTSGANIVSFNLDAFCSHGWSQGHNAPVGVAAAFAYTTALNALLARDSTQRLQVGDAAAVFWAQRGGTALESGFAQIFGTGYDDPDDRADQVRRLLEAVHTGRKENWADDTPFFVLGLAPNAARLSVRFWHQASVRDVAARIVQWFDDLAMVLPANARSDEAYPSLGRLLRTLALQGKAENIPPRLTGELMRAILSGTPYPAAWLAAVMLRCRAEQHVNHLRAASLRAYLRRAPSPPGHPTHSPNHPREITPMLDLHNPSAPYRLGRLFAVLEKIQEEAQPGINRGIRERYFAAASSTPVTVFPTLLRLKNHHLAKLTYPGSEVKHEQLLTEIMGGISAFPAHMGLPDQGLFAIGYYHQRQALFTARADRAAPTPPAAVAEHSPA